jgi:hypothetical protein
MQRTTSVERSLLKHTPPKPIGEVEAPDAEMAISRAAEMFRVREVDTFRLSARRVANITYQNMPAGLRPH